ncbi:hypothetical protein BVG79_00198 [Ketogulonicigenium robustum]|uniref:Glycosyltransferase n=1 Tax=Ketogulonicigenium robustum TaxID=92947 RepID=A0A1W6NWC1_9RHOB|nr:glycosyltransferase family 2 protein [Ketogulonicigenium robustum]ARO13558.1 hypothetical protein BVG79_00198 [Ketogulonicigenium robustum]
MLRAIVFMAGANLDAQDFVLQHFSVAARIYGDGQPVDFSDTWGDLVNTLKWSTLTTAGSLRFQLIGRGRYSLHLTALRAGGAVALPVIHGIAGQALTLPIGDVLQIAVRAQGDLRVMGCTLLGAQPAQVADLAICIPAYGAGRGLATKLEVIVDYMCRFPLGRFCRVIVVDQGLSEGICPFEGLQVIRQPNLGGAGGFARALSASQGASHCLFTDDDAGISAEALHRTHAFLSLATGADIAVAGAMTTRQRPDRIWENGAVFDRFCNGLFRDVARDDVDALAELERQTAQSAWQRQSALYGGWWFFAFARAHVRVWPFPYFLRGDDIGFSLANRFRIATLNGVHAAQDDFALKEGPQSLFYDLRGHLVHHMVFAQLALGRFAVGWIGALFVLRSLARFRYDEAEALLIAWRDVIAGPRRFALAPDAQPQRARIAALPRGAAHDLPAGGRSQRMPLWYWMATINGQLLPGGRGIAHLPALRRRDMAAIWGARAIAIEGEPVAARDRRRFFPLFLQFVAVWLLFILRFKHLVRAYRAAYPQLTTQQAWEGYASTVKP